VKRKSFTPALNSVVNGDPLPFVGPKPHPVVSLKTPVAPVGEGGKIKSEK